jgi:hypothetical protein
MFAKLSMMPSLLFFISASRISLLTRFKIRARALRRYVLGAQYRDPNIIKV